MSWPASSRRFATRRPTQYSATTDGGASWSDFSDPAVGLPNQVIISQDSATLYAAADQGIWLLVFDG